jgi:hypothetical protein
MKGPAMLASMLNILVAGLCLYLGNDRTAAFNFAVAAWCIANGIGELIRENTAAINCDDCGCDDEPEVRS